ncbi:MAG: hypothetical protein IJY39_07690 [Clostridia bacterium]|nr:hypothetical protein [Clostridia bacterium]
MYVIKEEKKKVNALKIVFLVVGIVAAVAAVLAAIMVWKKKKCGEKQIEEEIEAAINAAFAEDDEAETAEVQIVEAEEV